MTQLQGRQTDMDFGRFVQVLRRRWLVVLLAATLVPAAVLVVSLLRESSYTAKATLLFRDPQLGQQLFGSTLVNGSSDSVREAATNLQLLSLDAVAQRTARSLGDGFTQGSVESKVKLAAAGQADVVSIRATDPSPSVAAKIANEYAQQYIAFRRNADRQKIVDAQTLVQERLDAVPQREHSTANYRELQQRLQQLEILTSLQTGNAEQVQVAQPPGGPTSPKPVRNTAVGIVLGIVLGIGLAFLVDRLDRRLRDPREVEELFGRPILASVPAANELLNPRSPLPAAAAEAFRMLRANLRYFNVDHDVRSVIVTSPQPGDGKSTVCWNLASAAAAAGTRVLLIEADLRRPTLGRWMDERPQVGLSALLSHQGALEDAVVKVEFGDVGADGPSHSVDVIFAGALPPNPDELMESDRMREVIRTAEVQYDLVVIDTPPTSVVSDAIPLVIEASGVLVVSRLNRTTRGAASTLARQLTNLNARVLGVVVNGRRTGYGYGYEYGYDYAGETGGRALRVGSPAE